MDDIKETSLSKEQQLAIKQGEAYTEALQYLKSLQTHAETEAGDYIVTILSEKAVGFYAVQPEGDTQWELPLASQNLYIKIVVRDKIDLRLIPSLKIYCHLMDASGNPVADQETPFVWHPFLYHYGDNFEVPQEAEYMVEIIIEKPKFKRYDENVGDRYKEDETIKLGPLHLVPGRNEYGDLDYTK